jgi:hypothetical protein
MCATPLVIAVALLASCREPVAHGRGDSAACEQTYEFGNSGCFEIKGDVKGLHGQSLAGIVVGPRYPVPRAAFNTVYATSDSAGRFGFRISRFAGASPTVAGPDTISIYVVAADPRSAGVNVPATVQDSVLTVVTIAPVGAIPTPTTVHVTLPVP